MPSTTTMRLVRRLATLLAAGIVVGMVVWLVKKPYVALPEVDPASPYAEIEIKLQPLARRLDKPLPGEWLAQFRETGQSFDQYWDVAVRRTPERNTLYLCLVGDFTKDQQRILDLAREYLAIYFDVPVKVLKQVKLDDIPARAQRRHPDDGRQQLLTNYFLNERLKDDCPADAMAYVAFTAMDLWTRQPDGTDWNFVFGQADVNNRLGVWSLARFGDPAESAAAFHRCLKLTLGTATHETGHVLGMLHCVYYHCNMNGSNHLEEAMKRPLYPCPICLRKLCWNLQVEPVAHLRRLQRFCADHGFTEEAEYYRDGMERLQR